uniref:Uncharacterized protein n=1 Tax=Anguilla anguilla TaxID=7936 RepID=A0A0E9Q4B4_ANGAN
MLNAVSCIHTYWMPILTSDCMFNQAFFLCLFIKCRAASQLTDRSLTCFNTAIDMQITARL